ncbi:MAG: DUF5106 domain-containing protein [Bacteroidales bacterium]
MTACNEKKTDASCIGVKQGVLSETLLPDYAGEGDLLNRYRDGVWLADSINRHSAEIFENEFGNYIKRLKRIPSETQDKSIANLVRAMSADSLSLLYLSKQVEDRLFYSGSSQVNEELYLLFLHHFIKTDKFDSVMMLSFRQKQKMVSANRPGLFCSDLSFMTDKEQVLRLYQIESPYLLLYFYNPDCRECVNTLHQLKNSEIINVFQEKEQLQIVAIYPDADLAVWRSELNILPAGWIKGYDADQQIYTSRSFHLQAIPSLYLLAHDKRVLLKDTSVPIIEQVLKNL